MNIYRERPETLELTDEQAEVATKAFLDHGMLEPIAREVFLRWPRTSFLYFLAPRDPPKGAEGPDAEAAPEEPPRDYGFEFRPPNLESEGLDLLYETMRKTGAITRENDQDVFDVQHPLVRKLVEVAKFEIPERMMNYA